MAQNRWQTRDDPFEVLEAGEVVSDVSDTGDDDRMEVDTERHILRIAIDFGTTFSSVAYSRTPESQQITMLNDITCVAKYPADFPAAVVGKDLQPRQDVPTELWYTDFSDKCLQQHSGLKAVPPTVRPDHEEHSDQRSSRSSSVTSDDEERVLSNQTKHPPLDGNSNFDTLLWGFEVQNADPSAETHRNLDKRISRFKLLLDKPRDGSKKAVKTQMDTEAKVERLKRSKIVASNTDVIAHFLGKLLLHTKWHLVQNNQFDPTDDIEFILCVPAEWPSKACRIMQDAMAMAAQKSSLGQLIHGSLSNLFIVSEPEAAAACILAERLDRVYRGETIVILDAGGGTVDAVTYKIENTYPLRMSAEVVPPKTILCGASYINEEYAKFLFEKLKNETYLETNGNTLKSIIHQHVNKFENTHKRIWNYFDKTCPIAPISIPYLRKSETDPQLKQNYLSIDRSDVKRFYRSSLEGTVQVLENQLEMAKAKGETVQKVILTGGFSQSPYLQKKLRRFLERQVNLDGQAITLLASSAGSTAVARGAILRASNKKNGPMRISSCSYGFLSSEPYEPQSCPAHKATKPRIDRVDGEKYVHNTIRWLFQKGDELEVGKERHMVCRHVFSTTHRNPLICREELYVSDDKKESHYRRKHPMNKGAEIAGSIEVDMSFVKDRTVPQPVSQYSTFADKNKQVWVVEYDLFLIVDGRNLVYEARWPARGTDEGVQSEIQARGQTCIAATFKPGTA